MRARELRTSTRCSASRANRRPASRSPPASAHCSRNGTGSPRLISASARASALISTRWPLLRPVHTACKIGAPHDFAAAEEGDREPADIVLPNILAIPLSLLARLLPRLPRRGGHILLSGV